MFLSVVVPVYKEALNIEEFLKRMRPLLQGLTPEYEVIFSLDPSPDNSEEVLQKWNSQDQRVKYLKFSRRVGQPMATLAGLEFAKGDAVVVMDVDLQDPPELVPQMVEKFKQGYDVVYAQRASREGETLLKRFVAWTGYKVIRKLSDLKIPENTGDFRLMSRRAVDAVVALKESHGFLRGLVALVGFKQTSIVFERPARFAGQGNYNRFLGSILIGMNGVICFSNQLLRVPTFLGITALGISALGAILSVLAWFNEWPQPVQQPALVWLVLFMGGVQLMSVGILGAYLGRIYDESKQRPKYIVDAKVGF